MPLAVNDRSDEITALASQWPILEALMGGTPAMRAAGDKVLPKFPAEEIEAFNARVRTATLFPAYRRTVAVMAGKPFSKPATLSDDTPSDIATWCDDIDREGVNLHTFAAEMMAEALAYGLAGILVEAPKPISGATGVPTKAEQALAGIRPYWVRVLHGQILGFRIARVDGKAILTQLRIKETAQVPDGDFGDKRVERVRVLTPGAWEVWEKSDALVDGRAAWTTVERGVSGLQVIPFVPLYGSRLSYMLGETPLLDLAYLNVKHWQSQSDQDTILHVARVPILLATGFDEHDAIAIGASAAVKTTSAAAKLEWVEHTGAAIGAGANSLDALEQQMIQAGAELLVKKPGARSATESSNDAEANKSDLQRITEGFENSLDQGLQFMADYAQLGTSGNVTLYKDFGATLLSDASAQLILALEQGGVISTKTAILELQRRGTLSGDIDPEEEAEEVAEQGPPLGTITAPPAEPPPEPIEGADLQQAA